MNATNSPSRRHCSKCSEDLGFSEADPCAKCGTTMPLDELLERHPLPWTHHCLLIKDANGRQVIHTGGAYNDRGRIYEGRYLSGLNALLVALVNTRADLPRATADTNDAELWRYFTAIAVAKGFESIEDVLGKTPRTTGETTVEAALLVELRKMFPDSRVEIGATVNGFSVSVWTLSVIPERKYYWPGISLNECMTQVRAAAQTKAERGEK